jgi:hypothetical protein
MTRPGGHAVGWVCLLLVVGYPAPHARPPADGDTQPYRN